MSVIDFLGNEIPSYDKPNSSPGDAFVAKLNKCGQQKFFKLAGNDNSDYGISIASLKCGAVVVGHVNNGYTGTINPHDFDGNLTNHGIFVARICKSGFQKFFKTGGNTITLETIEVGTDKNSNIYVAGKINGPVIDFNGQQISSSEDLIFVAKLDSCGTQLYFKTAGTGSFKDRLGALNVDCDGNAYVTGKIDLMNAVDFAGEPIVTGLTGTAIYIAKLNTVGEQIYFKLTGPDQFEDSRFYDISSNCGNVYVTSNISSTSTDFSGNVIDPVNPSRVVAFITKLNKCGRQKFFKIAGGAYSRGLAIKTYNKGVAVAGRLEPPYNDFNGVPQTGYGFDDIFVANLDNYGNQKFFKLSGGGDGDVGISLDVDRKNNIYITGVLRKTDGYDFDNNLVNTSGNSRVFIAKLSSDGEQKFYKIAGGTDTNFPESGRNTGFKIIASPCGCVYVTGQVTKNQNPIYDFENNQVIENFTDEDHLIFVSKIDKHGVQKFFKVAGRVESETGSVGYDITLGCDGIYITGQVGCPLLN